MGARMRLHPIEPFTVKIFKIEQNEEYKNTCFSHLIEWDGKKTIEFKDFNNAADVMPLWMPKVVFVVVFI